MSDSGPYGLDLRLGAFYGLVLPSRPQRSPNPLGDRGLLLTCQAPDFPHLFVVKKHLQSLTHMSMIHYSCP